MFRHWEQVCYLQTVGAILENLYLSGTCSRQWEQFWYFAGRVQLK